MIIDKVLDIINKFIPDGENKAELEKELRELDIQELKEKGEYIEKISKCIPFVLPCFLLALLLMFITQFAMDVVFSILGRESPIVHIDDRLVTFCQMFMGWLFSKKTIEKFGKK
ncbi:MAG: hypothetical protein ACRC7S_17300 [Cetobacterium sp.]